MSGRVLAVVCASLVATALAADPEAPRPNVVVILADDLGFSDLGSYGGEIDTPHLDRLAAGGVRFTQAYNTSRCWPTRAALLTGYYAQAIRRDALPGGEFSIRDSRTAWARLLSELLLPAGYRSYHSGKWHIDGEPLEQGFVSSLQIEGGQNDYFDVSGITIEGQPIPKTAGFYVTTAVADHAVDCLRRHARDHATVPFFQYVAFTSPHFPLHAPPDLIEKYRARYLVGWDAIRRARYERIAAAGLVTTPLAAVPWDDKPPAVLPAGLAIVGPGEVNQRCDWERLSAEQREFQATKLAIHAAMIDAMDQAIGQIIAQLEAMNALDNTLIIFASDNGASAEMIVRGKGHDPTRPPGSQFTYLCLGPGGAACANAPFRGAKKSLREGGIATPWIVHWPRGITAKGELRRQPVHVIDVVPTVLDLAGIAAPKDHDGKPVPPMHGRSFRPALNDASAPPAHEQLWWCHEGNRAVRVGDWKLVAAAGAPWELYDLASDRCEATDLAAVHPDRVLALERAWTRIADECRGLASAAGAPPPHEQPRRKAAAERPPAARRPNILVIVADDQSPFDLRAYDPASRLETPVLDALAARGVVLDAAYHMGSFSGAVCTPSRHMLMTGRSLWHLSIGPGDGKRGLSASGFVRRCPADIEDHVLAAVFNAAGYDTMRTCKQGNSYEGANRRFTVRHDATKRQGTAEGGSAWHADRVLDFLATRAATGDADPFLVWFGFSHPHDTRDGTPELLAKYGAMNHADEARPPPLHHRLPPLPLNWLPRHPFDDTHMDVRDEVAVSGVWRRRDEATIRNEIGRQFACGENIDIQIGRVLDRLRSMNELDNTWVVYTADHGMAIGRHGLQGKQNLYEHTWRVPLIVAGPGVKAGSRAPGNVYLSDLLATLCDIAGIEAPASNEGTSFLPVLTGARPQVRDVLYGAYCGGAKPGIRCVRKGRWKLVKYESPPGDPETQLFDLEDNPAEFLIEHHDAAVAAVSHAAPGSTQKNLAADPAHAATRAELETLLLAEMRRLDDPFRFSDQPPVEALP